MAETVHVIELTDEELASLDGDRENVVVLPHLETMTARDRDVAVLTAYRSLVARGLVEAPTPQQVDVALSRARQAGLQSAEVPIRVNEIVHHVLTLRRGARDVVCLQRTRRERQDFRYFHLIDDVALDEVVEPAGLHRFGVIPYTTVLDAVFEYLVPEGANGEDGDQVELRAGEISERSAHMRGLVERLGEAHVAGDMVVRSAGDGGPTRLLGVFAGPRGLHLSVALFGSKAPVQFRAVSRGTLKACIHQELAERRR